MHAYSRFPELEVDPRMARALADLALPLRLAIYAELSNWDSERDEWFDLPIGGTKGGPLTGS